MTSEQATDKVYAATGVLLGTDKAPHIASYMAVMEARIAELEAALRQIEADCNADYPPSTGAIKYAARAALEGGKDEC